MKQQWSDLNEKYAQLSAREKWMIAGAGWVVIIFLFFAFLLEPTSIKHRDQTSRLNSLKGSIGQLHGQIAQINKKLNTNPDIGVDKQYGLLMKQSQDLSLRLEGVVDSLVTPTGMARLLQSVLDQTHNLKLISLESQPSEPITLSHSSENIGYYIHPVKIVITGKYFDIQTYLSQLEQMPMKYYWRSFDYNVTNYPTAKLVLVVYTLGAKQEFIGG